MLEGNGKKAGGDGTFWSHFRASYDLSDLEESEENARVRKSDKKR